MSEARPVNEPATRTKDAHPRCAPPCTLVAAAPKRACSPRRQSFCSRATSVSASAPRTRNIGVRPARGALTLPLTCSCPHCSPIMESSSVAMRQPAPLRLTLRCAATRKSVRGASGSSASSSLAARLSSSTPQARSSPETSAARPLTANARDAGESARSSSCALTMSRAPSGRLPFQSTTTSRAVPLRSSRCRRRQAAARPTRPRPRPS